MSFISTNSSLYAFACRISAARSYQKRKMHPDHEQQHHQTSSGEAAHHDVSAPSSFAASPVSRQQLQQCVRPATRSSSEDDETDKQTQVAKRQALAVLSEVVS